jgi:hypothetical protein
MNKRTIRMGFVDFGPDPGLADLLLKMLSPHYDVQQVAKPDYVVHSVFEKNVLHEPGVRIFFTGENVRPDFNISDYAVSFDWLSFGDRHHRIPLYRFYPEYAEMLRPRPPAADPQRGKPVFCAFVCTNPVGAPERKVMFDLLGRYKRVESGGGWLNNTGGRVADKRAFQSRAKFVMAFENSSAPGYTTEKLMQAMAADAVPIYWGDPLVARDFNPRAFVNCHDFPSFEAALERVMAIDRDDDLWRAMVSEPCFRDGHEPDALRETVILKFFNRIFEQPLQQAFRRDRTIWGPRYEQRQEIAFYQPWRQFSGMVRERSRSIRRKWRNRTKNTEAGKS